MQKHHVHAGPIHIEIFEFDVMYHWNETKTLLLLFYYYYYFVLFNKQNGTGMKSISALIQSSSSTMSSSWNKPCKPSRWEGKILFYYVIAYVDLSVKNIIKISNITAVTKISNT